MRSLSTLYLFRHVAFCLGLGAVVLINSGCRSYRLGHPGDLPYESIFVMPAQNKSYAPQAQALLSSEVRQTILRDTRVKLVAKEANADAVLSMEIVRYDRMPTARSQDDTVVARDFDLTLTVICSLYDQKNGNYLFRNREVSQTTNAFTENPFATDLLEEQGFLQAEYDAMPRLTRDLARKISDEVLSAW
ncbi:MAG: LPS assembly lipoprotein LptE [Verrucomicrobiota bacterium]